MKINKPLVSHFGKLGGIYAVLFFWKQCAKQGF